MPPQLQLRDVALRFGSSPLLARADLSISLGDRIALVGRNGSGKSTLLKIAAGEIAPDQGSRFAQPGAAIRYLPQDPDLSSYPTIDSYVLEGLEPTAAYRAQALLEELKLDQRRDPKTLSGGEARRAGLAKVLAPMPEILLMDEPTNHLDLVAIEWLEAELRSMRSALAVISHDKRFLSDLTTSTVWLDRGETRRLEQGFAVFEEWRDRLLEEEEKERHKLDRKIAAEEHWIRYGVTARRKRNVRRVAELAELRQSQRSNKETRDFGSLASQEGKVSGAVLVDAEEVSKSWGEVPIVKNFSIRLARGNRVGLIGPNGAGKTTLVGLMTGRISPDSGQVKLGSQITMASLDQRRAELAPTTTVVDALTGGGSEYVAVNGEKRHVLGYLQDFLFAPEQARQPIGRLSGGELGRLMLARALAIPSNLLVLDEPTNDLDLETLDLLQEILTSYKGTLILVSHDRDLLDSVATSVVVAEGGGRWAEYAGGYRDMVAQRGYGISGIPKAAASKARPETPRPASTKTTTKRKLSFNQKQALETLPAKIEALRHEMKTLEAQLASPAMHPDKVRTITERYGVLKGEIDRAEDAWLELEMLREQLDQAAP